MIRPIFGVGVIYKTASGKLCRHYFDIISDCLTHDSTFVTSALGWLFKTPEWNALNLSSVAIWSDNAPHFRNRHVHIWR